MENNIIIKDTRTKFKSTTFSNYKKAQVIKKLNHAIYYQKIEEAFFWTCELMCTNLYLDLWNIYFIFACKYIHIDNPKLPIYINKKFKDFKTIATNTSNDYELRNNPEVRLLFCSLTLILSLSNKYTILDDLNYKFNFQIENIYENLKAPHLKFVDSIFKQHDPKEFIIPFNELLYHLTETKNKIDINYWVNWIIHYDALCNSKKKHLLCVQRDIFIHKNEKQSKNVIWILWSIILDLFNKKNEKLKQIINNIFELFCVKYVVSFNKKRKYMIYNCIELYLRNNIELDIPLIKNTNTLTHLEHNINIIFEQIKKNEVYEISKEPLSKTDEKMKIYENIYNNL
jgi:hypothetical protein